MIIASIFYLLTLAVNIPETGVLGDEREFGQALASHASAADWTLEQVVALAIARHQTVLQARFSLRQAEIVRATIGIWPNPLLEYNIANIVLGKGNDQDRNLQPSTFSQLIHQVTLVQMIDIWSKKWAAEQGASKAIEVQQFALQDCLRELIGAVRASFVQFQREQYQVHVAHEAKERFVTSFRLLQLKERVGELAKSQVAKANLEGLLYEQTERHANVSLEKSRNELATLIGLADSSILQSVSANWLDWSVAEPNQLIEKALTLRPDLLAMRKQLELNKWRKQEAIRSALPDFGLGIGYSNSYFQVSGDNPHTLATKIVLELPVFQREQALIASVNNEQEQQFFRLHYLETSIRRSIHAFSQQLEKIKAMRMIVEESSLQSAKEVLSITEKSFAAGACSLLELLEAQRTYLNVELQYFDLKAEESLLINQLQQEVGVWQ